MAEECDKSEGGSDVRERYLSYVDSFIHTLISGIGRKRNNCLAIKHYNTFDIPPEDIEQIRQQYPENGVFYHSFYENNMTDAYEPFLGLVKELYQQNQEELTIEEFLEECGVYSQQKELFSSYITKGICRRREEVLLGEVYYEQDRMIDSLIKVMIYCSQKKPFLLVLNGFHLAGKSTIKLMKALLNYEENENLCVLLAYNSLHTVPVHVTSAWEEYLETLEENGCVINGEMMMNQGEGEEEAAVFRFETANIPMYMKRLHNMYETLDLDQARYYLQIIYRKIEIENLYLKEADKFQVFELYARVSILADDIPTALMVCENLQSVKWQKERKEGEYLYYYLQGMTQMYSGSLKEAISCAQKCKVIAESMDSECDVFKAELLEVMARMSGWHNIMFCANDVEVEPQFLEKAEKYGYWNHLAYTYIFAYDNSKELFQELTGIEERLVHYQKGLELAKQMDNQYLLVEAYRKNIMIASVHGLFEISDYYYYKWKDLIKESDPFSVANIYNGLGYNCCATEKYERANECYNKALKIFYDLDCVDYMGETLYNMAINSILAEDFESAYTYLDLCLKIVRKKKLNDLRICNISKLFGLLALCSVKLNMIYNAKAYLKSNKQFLSHILEKDKETTSDSIDPSFTLCDDDIFLSFYVQGLIATEEELYEKALESFEAAKVYMERSKGFLFFSYVQYHVAKAELYTKMGKPELTKQELELSLEYAQKHKNVQKAIQLQNILDGQNTKNYRYDLRLQKVSMEEITQIIKQAGILRDYEDMKKQMEFLTIWQKIIAIDGKDRSMLVDNAMNVFSINSNLDGIIFIKYYNGKPQILYENTPIPLSEEMLPVLDEYFTRHRSGFVTSKLQANYNEYHRVISLFGASKVCSMLCTPFYVNEKLDSIFVSYILMKDNWSSSVNKYMLDESDYNIFTLAFQQLLDALAKLENHRKIQNINAKLEKSAVTDFLTGLYNRDGFFLNMENMLANALKEKRSLDISLIYVDLDNFKYYNDTFGHDVGDMVLKEISGILKKVSKNYGFATRFGGDEFLVVLYGAGRERAEKTAQQIMKKIRDAQCFIPMIEEFLGESVEVPENKKVSCSMGIVLRENIREKQEFGEIIKEADQALYYIKRSTKNDYRFAD